MRVGSLRDSLWQEESKWTFVTVREMTGLDHQATPELYCRYCCLLLSHFIGCFFRMGSRPTLWVNLPPVFPSVDSPVDPGRDSLSCLKMFCLLGSSPALAAARQETTVREKEEILPSEGGGLMEQIAKAAHWFSILGTQMDKAWNNLMLFRPGLTLDGSLDQLMYRAPFQPGLLSDSSVLRGQWDWQE